MLLSKIMTMIDADPHSIFASIFYYNLHVMKSYFTKSIIPSGSFNLLKGKFSSF